MARRAVSSIVGRYGDLRAAMAVVFSAVAEEGKPFSVDGEELGDDDIFWIRWERRGVAEAESICVRTIT